MVQTVDPPNCFKLNWFFSRDKLEFEDQIALQRRRKSDGMILKMRRASGVKEEDDPQVALESEEENGKKDEIKP